MKKIHYFTLMAVIPLIATSCGGATPAPSEDSKVDSIVVVDPIKEYLVGDEFIKPTVKAYNSSKVELDVNQSEVTFEGFDSTQETFDQEIKVTYSQKSTTYTVNVNAPGAMVDKDIQIQMKTHFKEDDEIYDTVRYNDAYFLADSKTTNYDLALLSAMSSGASYCTTNDDTGNKIENFLREAGYKNIKKNQYYAEGIKLEDSVGVIAGRKMVTEESGKKYTLLAVMPRNAGYGLEWRGNFNFGVNGPHKGFMLARDEMLRFVKQYVSTFNIRGDVKVWSAGYSRGAAVANMFGGYLIDNSAYLSDAIIINPKDVFVYTIGTPKNTLNNLAKTEILSVSGARVGYKDTEVAPYTYTGTGNIDLSEEKYKGIHNFIAVGDYVTKLPSDQWGFTRYGQTEAINYGSEEMLNYLKDYDQETADKFKDGKNYASELSYKSFDLSTYEVLEINEKYTPDQLISERLEAMSALEGGREASVEKGYDEVLGSAATIFGADSSDVVSRLTDNIGPALKMLFLNYLQYVSEKTGGESNEALATILMDLIGLMGKEVADKENYTDQDFLKDLLDYLFNDYVDGDVKAIARVEKISSLIPAPFNDVLTKLLDYQKTKAIRVTTVDSLLFLLASYIHDNPTDLLPMLILSLGASQLAKYAETQPNFDTMLAAVGFLITHKEYKQETLEEKCQAALKDLIDCCAVGSEDGVNSADYCRGALLSMLCLAINGEHIKNLILNGSHDNEGEVVKEAAKLSVFCEDIVKLLCVDLTLEEAANKSVKDFADAIKSEAFAKYYEAIGNHPEQFRKILITVVFNPGNTYSLANDIKNAYTFVDTVMFIAPAHFHEMYISYLKTQMSEEPNA